MMSGIPANELARLGRAMRQAQRKHTTTRETMDLELARKAEIAFDQACAAILDVPEKRDRGLFDAAQEGAD